jgi:hypothetical protein
MIHPFSWQFLFDHPALPGHLSHQPIAPGVVLLDRLELFAKRIPAIGDGRWRIERDASLIAHGLLLAKPVRFT